MPATAETQPPPVDADHGPRPARPLAATLAAGLLIAAVHGGPPPPSAVPVPPAWQLVAPSVTAAAMTPATAAALPVNAPPPDPVPADGGEGHPAFAVEPGAVTVIAGAHPSDPLPWHPSSRGPRASEGPPIPAGPTQPPYPSPAPSLPPSAPHDSSPPAAQPTPPARPAEAIAVVAAPPTPSRGLTPSAEPHEEPASPGEPLPTSNSLQTPSAPSAPPAPWQDPPSLEEPAQPEAPQPPAPDDEPATDTTGPDASLERLKPALARVWAARIAASEEDPPGVPTDAADDPVRTFDQWWASIVACAGEHPEQRDAVTAQIELLLLMIEQVDPEAPATGADAGPCDETVAWAVQFLDLATMTARGAPEPWDGLEGTMSP